MAALIDAERIVVLKRLMARLSITRTPISISKTELKAAVDAVDNWIEANAASYNSAIPQPARSNLTVAQKAELLSAVALRKFEV